MTMATRRITLLPHSRIWLPFACLMLAFFSFASMACAAQCSGVACTQTADTPSHNEKNDTHGITVMIGGDCVMCCNVMTDEPVLTSIEPLRTLPYATAPMQQSSRHIVPDIPPPRKIDFL